jgi:hypothetical protein
MDAADTSLQLSCSDTSHREAEPLCIEQVSPSVRHVDFSERAMRCLDDLQPD